MLVDLSKRNCKLPGNLERIKDTDKKQTKFSIINIEKIDIEGYST